MEPITTNAGTAEDATLNRRRVSLLTGGFDKPYAYGISLALASLGIEVEVIGSNEIDSPEMHSTQGLTFLNFLARWRQNASAPTKLVHVVYYYVRLILYSLRTQSKVFHILWNYKLAAFDRTLLLFYFKALGKKAVFTAHNVNAGVRDGADTKFNRWTLRMQYRLVDHIFVHTPKMRDELCTEYFVPARKVTVIPFGVNNALPQTDLTSKAAKDQLQIIEEERVILFFGNIRPYKGLEYLVEAVGLLPDADGAKYCLLIAGAVNKHSADYWAGIRAKIRELNSGGRIRVLERAEYIPDAEAEIYFKAADVSVLPYTYVYQSGVLLLSYSFGVPVIAANCGSLKDDIIEGETGFVYESRDVKDLARKIQSYFKSDLYRHLEKTRHEIRTFAKDKYSWQKVGRLTREVYESFWISDSTRQDFESGDLRSHH